MNNREEIGGQRRMGLIMQALAWLAFMGLLGAGFSEMLEKQRNPNQSVETRSGAAGVREITLQRNRYGHYVSTGQINGEPVEFMLDTGATSIAIPESAALELGLRRGHPITVETASGVATAYAVRLEQVSIGGISLQNVPAAILPDMPSEEVLLGMSFLRHIEFTQRGSTLVLRQYGQSL